MSYDVTAPLPGQGKRKGGAITFWIGVVVLVVSVALAIITGVASYNAVMDVVDDAEGFSGDTTITLQEGDQRTIYQVEEGTDQADCVVTGPDGADVPLSRGEEFRGTDNGTTYVNVGTITARMDGDHQISCEGPRTLVGPAFDVRGAVGGFFGVVAGIGGAFLGLVLAVIGAILWFVGRGEGKRALAYGTGGYGQGGYGPGGYGPGGYGPGGYGQGGYQPLRTGHRHRRPGDGGTSVQRSGPAAS